MTTPIQPDQTVYDIKGREGIAVMPHPTSNGWMVHPIYNVPGGGDDEPPYTEPGPLTHWPQVYAQPPVEKLHARVAELTQQCDAKRAEMREVEKLRREIAATEANDKKRMAALSMRSEALTRIEDFLDGKITHYVKVSSFDWPDDIGREIEISEAKKEKCGDDDYTRDLKLLCLFGRAKGDLAWMLHRYSDGSGSGYGCSWVYPCCSLEEAQEKARKQVARQIEKWQQDTTKTGLLESIVKNGARHGVEIPTEIHLALEGIEKQRKLAAMKKAKAAYEKAVKELGGEQP